MRDRTYRVVIAIFRAAFAAFGVRFDIRGASNLPTQGPGIVAANHIGLLDFGFVGLVAYRRGRLVRFMAKASVFGMPIIGPMMKAMRHIPVDRASGSSAYRQGAIQLGLGQLVGIFPEATVSRAWTLKPFKVGAAALAVQTKAPIIPIIGWGGHRLLTVDGRHSWRRHIPVTLLVGEPIFAGHRSVAEVGKQLKDTMAVMLDQVQRDYPDRPRNDADRWWLPRHLGGTAPTPADAAVVDAAKMIG